LLTTKLQYATLKDKLQNDAYKLNQTITERSLTICIQKTKLMTFKGRDPVRSKIVIDKTMMEQVNSFIYLENFIAYESGVGSDSK
jgi:hypothetical protein